MRMTMTIDNDEDGDDDDVCEVGDDDGWVTLQQPDAQMVAK